MPTIRYNKIPVPVNSDAYALTADLAKMADKVNAPVLVSSPAERDALTPPGGKYVGLQAGRQDALGSVETWDGTNWRGLFIHSEWTGTNSGTVPANTLWGVGPIVRDGTNGINDSGAVTSPGNDALTLPFGVWDIYCRVKMTANASGTTFLSVKQDTSTGAEIASADIPANASVAQARFLVNVTAATQTFYFRFQTGATGATLTSRVIAQKRW
jgi:hypothetical protein